MSPELKRSTSRPQNVEMYIFILLLFEHRDSVSVKFTKDGKTTIWLLNLILFVLNNLGRKKGHIGVGGGARFRIWGGGKFPAGTWRRNGVDAT